MEVNESMTKRILVIIIPLIVLLFLIYLFVPFKVSFPSRVSQLLFIYDDDDSVDIKQQLSYSVGSFGKSAKVDNDGNVQITINRFVLFALKNRCAKEIKLIDRSDIKISNKGVIVYCTKEQVPKSIIDADVFVRFLVLRNICEGGSPNKINLFVKFSNEDTGETYIDANWPYQEYNIDRKDFFDD